MGNGGTEWPPPRYPADRHPQALALTGTTGHAHPERSSSRAAKLTAAPREGGSGRRYGTVVRGADVRRGRNADAQWVDPVDILVNCAPRHLTPLRDGYTRFDVLLFGSDRRKLSDGYVSALLAWP